MKIEKNLPLNVQFWTTEVASKQANTIFEEYLRNAILELEHSELLKEKTHETLKLLSDQVRFSLELLEKISKMSITTSISSTVGDFLLSQAFELDKISDSLPDGALKNLFKESALYIGIEAEKIRKGYYNS